jgi:hypothetical protein
MPLPLPDPDEAMPKDLREMADGMRRRYVETEGWWGAGIRDQGSGIRNQREPGAAGGSVGRLTRQ